MEGTTMYTHLSRGAAAALLGITVAATAGAQVVRTRDTVVVRSLEPGRFDSIKVLLRRLEQQQPGSEEFMLITRRMDELMGATMRKQLRVPTPAFIEAAIPKGYLGLNFQSPRRIDFDSSGQKVTFFTYPTIISVEPESPAGRVGIVPGDVLLAYDGIDVAGHEFNMTKLLVPERKLDVAVRHEGERKEYTVTVGRLPERMALRMAVPDLPPAPPSPPRVEMRRPALAGGMIVRTEVGPSRAPMLPGGIWLISPNGVLGANMSSVGPELAKTLRLSTGVLVNDVPENSPAYVSGLRAGDVVVSIAGKPVASMEELHAVFMQYMRAHEAPFRVVRDRKSRDITVRW